MMATTQDLRTVHLYYDDTENFTCEGCKVLVQDEVVRKDGEQTFGLVLDTTVMHPQGGGQPADTGVIRSTCGGVVFQVAHVQKPKGSEYIQHLGDYQTDQRFVVGDNVNVEIDGSKRMLHARIHSAGHLLDSAFSNIGFSELKPSKGYHFPDGPYVEYIGNIAAEEREEVLAKLNKEMEKLIKDATPVKVTKNEKGERVVMVGGLDCMCGGTHVKNTQDIKRATATKIKKNKKCIRVSYVLTDE